MEYPDSGQRFTTEEAIYMGLHERDYGREYGDETPWDRHQRMQNKPAKSYTIILIVITCAIFLIDTIFFQKTLDDGTKASLLPELLATRRDTIIQPWTWFQFLTYGFLHDTESIRHVGFNMLGLFFFGRTVEQTLGSQEFLRFYLVSIVIGGIVGSLTFWATGVPAGSVIGASGAVVAIVILFAFHYPNQEVLLMFVLPVKAWVVAVLFVAGDIAGALGAMGSGTAFTVHLSGAAFAALYFRQRWSLAWLDFGRFGNIRQNMAQRSRRMKLKIHDPDKKIEDEAAEADRILEKISQSGQESLTSAERRLLERYSQRQRQKRNPQ